MNPDIIRKFRREVDGSSWLGMVVEVVAIRKVIDFVRWGKSRRARMARWSGRTTRWW